MVAILISAKLATLGLLKIKVFRNKGYDAIISVHNFSHKTLSRTQIILQMWPFDQGVVTLAFL